MPSLGWRNLIRSLRTELADCPEITLTPSVREVACISIDVHDNNRAFEVDCFHYTRVGNISHLILPRIILLA
jgi:hypothetical protein